jgi:hypothetical protein
MGGICEMRRLDGFRGNETRTNFHNDRFRQSTVGGGGANTHADTRTNSKPTFYLLRMMKVC